MTAGGAETAVRLEAPRRDKEPVGVRAPRHDRAHHRLRRNGSSRAAWSPPKAASPRVQRVLARRLRREFETARTKAELILIDFAPEESDPDLTAFLSLSLLVPLAHPIDIARMARQDPSLATDVLSLQALGGQE